MLYSTKFVATIPASRERLEAGRARPRINFAAMRVKILTLLALFAFPLIAQPHEPSLFREMRWRGIGPYRGGRTVAGVGVPQEPGVFYIGVNNGGVWKTTDYGRTWIPLFDD